MSRSDMVDVPTIITVKDRLSLAVLFIRVSTFGTMRASESGVGKNEFARDGGVDYFVGQSLAER